MGPREVLIVGETPSLGRSILDLLRAEGIPCRLVHDVARDDPGLSGPSPTAAVIVACNEPFCRTARRWSRGELPVDRLVVIGARDPQLADRPGLRLVPLPLSAEPLVALARSLLGGGSTARPRDRSMAPR